MLRYVMSDEARHVAFGVLSLREVYEGMSDAEMKERQEFAYEAAVRIATGSCPRRCGSAGVNPKDVVPLVLSDPTREMFQQMLFAKIVPNCKKLGLLDRNDEWLRRHFEEMGVIQFEHAEDTGEEYIKFELDRDWRGGVTLGRGPPRRPRPGSGRRPSASLHPSRQGPRNELRPTPNSVISPSLAPRRTSSPAALELPSPNVFLTVHTYFFVLEGVQEALRTETEQRMPTDLVLQQHTGSRTRRGRNRRGGRVAGHDGERLIPTTLMSTGSDVMAQGTRSPPVRAWRSAEIQ